MVGLNHCTLKCIMRVVELCARQPRVALQTIFLDTFGKLRLPQSLFEIVKTAEHSGERTERVEVDDIARCRNVGV